jgi:DnaJ-class molecular chaperone
MSASSKPHFTGFVDYYALLGVHTKATTAEIDKAFHRAAMKYHPDKHPAEKFAEANAAFIPYRDAHETLTEPTKRHLYNRSHFDYITWHEMKGKTVSKTRHAKTHNVSRHGHSTTNDVLSRPEAVHVQDVRRYASRHEGPAETFTFYSVSFSN